MKTIRQQLLIGLLVGTLLCLCLAGAAMYFTASGAANALFDYQLLQIGASVPDEMPAARVQIGERDPEEDVIVQVWNARRQLIYVSRPDVSLPLQRDMGFTTISVDDEPWRVLSKRQRDTVIQVAQSVHTRERLILEMVLRSLAPFILLIPALVVLIGAVVRRALRPLQQVATAVRQREPNALEPLPTQHMPPEIVPMVEAINDLMWRLQNTFDVQQAFVADAAHELRTPLTALKLQMQLAERAVTAEQRGAAFAKLHQRLDRATHLVQQLLVLARHEAEPEQLGVENVDMAELAQQVVAEQSLFAESKQIDLGVETGGARTVVHGHRDSLRVLLNNLVDNALRYTPAGGRVDVLLLERANALHVVVQDTGPGIPESEQGRVFNRFHRIAGAGAEGSGLGLAIVKNVADRHGASVGMRPGPTGSGLMVSVIFERRGEQNPSPSVGAGEAGPVAERWRK